MDDSRTVQDATDGEIATANVPLFGEPWHVLDCDDLTAQIYAIGFKAIDGHAISSREARRIVAAVNFCREFPTHVLESRHIVYQHGNLSSLADVPGFSGLIVCVKEGGAK